MGQQIKFPEENDKKFSPLSYSNADISPGSLKENVNIAVETKNCASECGCKFNPKETQTTGTHTRDFDSCLPSVMMNSVASDLPPMSLFSACSASSNSICPKPAMWNVPHNEHEVIGTECGFQASVLNECDSQLCAKDKEFQMKLHTHLNSSYQLELAGLNCTITSDISPKPLLNCSSQENSFDEDVEMIKNYISDLDEDFEEYSASDVEESSNGDNKLTELSSLFEKSKSILEPKCFETVPENLNVTFKGFTAATSNVKVFKYGDSKQYICCECDSVFAERFLVVSHLESHVGFRPFQCVMCNESTASEVEASAHYETHFNEGSYVGSEGAVGFLDNKDQGCSHEADNILSCKNCEETLHCSKHQPTQKLVKELTSELFCSVCKNRFLCLAELESHNCSSPPGQSKAKESVVKNKSLTVTSEKEKTKREKSSNLKFTRSCEKCNKTFRTSKALREHEVVHTGARDFPCDICGKAFGTGANMRIHRLTHSDVRPFSCQICGATFRQKDSLKVHARKHTGERPYACNICEMTFDRSFTLKNHMLTHASEKLFVCSVCGKKFSTRGGLINHESVHFKSQPRKVRGPRAKPGTGGWGCNECGKTYSTRSNLTMHQRSTHQPLQISHICSICGKVYKSRDSLEVHLRTHAEVRPYQCPMCSRSFYRNYTLKLHILTHTGEKPHHCPVEGCKRSFAQTSSLSYHIRNHKKQEERLLKKDKSKQKCIKQTGEVEFPLGKTNPNTFNKNSIPVPVSETYSMIESQISAQDDLKIEMGGIMLPDNIVLHDTLDGIRTVDLHDNLNNHVSHVPSVGWGESIPLMSLMSESVPLDQLQIPSTSNLNLDPQHCSPAQMMTLATPESLSLLEVSPVTGLFHQECSQRSVDNQIVNAASLLGH